MSNPFSRAPAPIVQAAPAPQAPPRMPDPQDPGVVEAKRRAAIESLSRGGRASTILTGRKAAPAPSAAPGFDSYDKPSLGG